MRKLLLLAGAAAMAASAPALAEKGGKGGGKGQAAAAQGGKPGKAEKGPKMQTQGKPAKAARQAARGGKPDRAQRQMARGGKPDKAQRRAVKRHEQAVRQARTDRVRRIEDRRIVDLRDLRGDGRRFVTLGQGCPPGLAKKNNGCLPPGQAKKLWGVGDRIQPSWFNGYTMPVAYQSFYYDTPDHYFRYDDDGYIYRVDRDTNLISGLVPLFGGGFAVGQPLPAGYDVYNVPYQYRDTWYDTDEDHYRYGDGGIYRVDAESGLIESIVALLAGDLNVGQALPSGYDAYNVPMDYRDRYYDTDDYMYRYADGNIYQVDAETQIIQAIVEMLI